MEVLTFCVMDNHFHLLVRVPHRPEGVNVSLEVVVARLDRALGEESAKLMHRNLGFWRTTKSEAAIEEWRQQQVAPPPGRAQRDALGGALYFDDRGRSNGRCGRWRRILI